MKLSTILRITLPGMALLLTTGAFAANQANKVSLNLYEPVTVSEHRLAPGQYELRWNGAGPNIDLSIVSQGKIVATVPARLIEVGGKSRDNATMERKNDDGTESLTQINFAGKHYALAFDNEAAMSESTSQGEGNQ
jgi:hypothetical protein